MVRPPLPACRATRQVRMVPRGIPSRLSISQSLIPASISWIAWRYSCSDLITRALVFTVSTGYDKIALVKRIHRRLFRINDRIQSISRELTLVNAELFNHRSIDEDAQRDAVVGNYIDREEAGRTAGDVRRFERTAFYLRVRRAKLIKTRDRLLARLPD